MKIHHLDQEQFLPITPAEAWEFFSSPANLDRITPPDLGFKITSPVLKPIFNGQIITYRVRVAPLVNITWVTEIKHVEHGLAFVDEQRFGPYRFWHHRHTFHPREGGVLMCDSVHYAMPYGPLGALIHRLFVRRKLEWIFNSRKILLANHFGSASGQSITVRGG